jgi:hypothetical protein
MFQGCGFAHSSVLERQEILHWPNQDRKVLEEGDVEEGLNAAAQIGDDRMQKHAQGYLVPEGFTHGGIQQRVRWFAGLKSQDLNHAIRFPRERCSEIFRNVWFSSLQPSVFQLT